MDVSTETKEFVHKTNERNTTRVGVMVFPLTKQAEATEAAEPGKSKAAPEDEALQGYINKGLVIEPPFDLLTLAMLQETNGELGPCVQAMEVNIEGFGHRLVPRIKTEDLSEELRDVLAAEKLQLDNFFLYAAGDDSFTLYRRKLRIDLETTGNAEYEVIRNAARRIQAFNHLPSYQIMLGPQDADPIKVEVPAYEIQPDGSVKVVEITTWKRFRRYVQNRMINRRNLSVSGTWKHAWFKEYGDPRHYHVDTGEEIKESDLAKVPEEKRANELVHLKLYSPRSPYGLPRFIGNLLSIFGDRAAGEINYITFRNNNMPSMALLISNGKLTEGSVDRIKDFMAEQIQGSSNYSRVLLLEAESPDVEGEDSGHVKIDLKPLTSEQHTDALFQNYQKNNQERIRRSFRLPPILLGASDDYSRSTSETARRLADEQVFAPERDEFDRFINRRIFPAMGIRYHRFKSNSPNTTDNTELVRILAGAEKTGGMTPRIARMMHEDILSVELPPFPKDFPADVPFSMTMAEAVKNLAQPAEVGQQITALKMIEALTKSDIPLFGGTEDEVAERLLRVRDRVEEAWRKEALEAETEEE